MSDFLQHGLITTLHDLGTANEEEFYKELTRASQVNQIGLVLPVTAADMQSRPFLTIINELQKADYIQSIVVSLNATTSKEDYHRAQQLITPIADKTKILWLESPHIQKKLTLLEEVSGKLETGKGLAVWLAFGSLLANPKLQVFATHDCDILNYHHFMLARLCMPLAHPGLDFEFCKAYYARYSDRFYGRVARLLVSPLLQSLGILLEHEPFLDYLMSFRYPLSGEFAITANLARSNRVPNDWGLEIGMLAEVYRNTAMKRVCQIDLARPYEHKHQALVLEKKDSGLMKMAAEILRSIFTTFESQGQTFSSSFFSSLRATYLRSAQESIRQYHADSVLNGLYYDRHLEEKTVESFSRLIDDFYQKRDCRTRLTSDIPNWMRIMAAIPNFPQMLVETFAEDRATCSV
ncbi:MAG: glycosyl transferase [Pirellulaceae bacterium]|nr:glycosyl transferase [Pirellulaceae bacterium]